MLDGGKGGFPFKFSLKHQCIATCSSWSYSTIFLRQRCYDIICQELSFDVFTDSSRSFFADLARALEIDIRDGWMPHHQTVFLTEWGVYIFAFEFANDTANMGCTLVQHGSNKKVKVLLACFFCSCKSKGRGTERYGMDIPLLGDSFTPGDIFQRIFFTELQEEVLLCCYFFFSHGLKTAKSCC